jgi:hypothetical protein
MTEHSETPEDAEVEAHGLKEVAATGISAAALLAAGAGTAAAATPASHATGAKAAQADPTIKQNRADPTNKIAKKTDATIKLKRAGAQVTPNATDKI